MLKIVFMIISKEGLKDNPPPSLKGCILATKIALHIKHRLSLDAPDKKFKQKVFFKNQRFRRKRNLPKPKTKLYVSGEDTSTTKKKV